MHPRDEEHSSLFSYLCQFRPIHAKNFLLLFIQPKAFIKWLCNQMKAGCLCTLKTPWNFPHFVKNTNVPYNDWSNAFSQLYARLSWAITRERCKAVFRSTETSWSSEIDGNKLTKKDLHWNKRNGSWEKKSEIMLMNWFPALVWNMVLCFACQHK